MTADFCASCGSRVTKIRVKNQDLVCDGPYDAIKCNQKSHYPGPKTGRVVDVFTLHSTSCAGGHEFTKDDDEKNDDEKCNLCGHEQDRPWHGEQEKPPA